LPDAANGNTAPAAPAPIDSHWRRLKIVRASLLARSADRRSKALEADTAICAATVRASGDVRTNDHASQLRSGQVGF
jgi:hypothetical protein